MSKAIESADALDMHVKTLQLAGRNDGMVEDMIRAASMLRKQELALDAAMNCIKGYIKLSKHAELKT